MCWPCSMSCVLALRSPPSVGVRRTMPMQSRARRVGERCTVAGACVCAGASFIGCGDHRLRIVHRQGCRGQGCKHLMAEGVAGRDTFVRQVRHAAGNSHACRATTHLGRDNGRGRVSYLALFPCRRDHNLSARVGDAAWERHHGMKRVFVHRCRGRRRLHGAIPELMTCGFRSLPRALPRQAEAIVLQRQLEPAIPITSEPCVDTTSVPRVVAHLAGRCLQSLMSRLSLLVFGEHAKYGITQALASGKTPSWIVSNPTPVSRLDNRALIDLSLPFRRPRLHLCACWKYPWLSSATLV